MSLYFSEVLLPQLSASPKEVLEAIVEVLKNESFFFQADPRIHVHFQAEPNFEYLEQHARFLSTLFTFSILI